MKAMEENAAKNPDKLLDVKLALQDGNHVAVPPHVRQNARDRGAAVVHIFRFEDERIVELGTWAKRFRRTRRTGTACSNQGPAPPYRTCRRNTPRRHRTCRRAACRCLARPKRRCDS